MHTCVYVYISIHDLFQSPRYWHWRCSKPQGVLRRKFNIFDMGARQRHHLARDLEHLGARLAELVLHVDVRRGDEGVDARKFGPLDSISACVDVLRRARQPRRSSGSVGRARVPAWRPARSR